MDKNAVIIINSDHGYRDLFNSQEHRIEDYGVATNYENFLAIYSPYEINFPEHVYNVNLFRIILNDIFEQKISLLEDQIILACENNFNGTSFEKEFNFSKCD